jgi:hypothetical protein
MIKWIGVVGTTVAYMLLLAASANLPTSAEMFAAMGALTLFYTFLVAVIVGS